MQIRIAAVVEGGFCSGVRVNEVSRVWVPPWVLDIRGTVECLHRGSGDPAMRYAPDGSVWRASHTPDGPGTLRLLAVPEGVRGTGWGPGGPWLVEHFPELIGEIGRATV